MSFSSSDTSEISSFSCPNCGASSQKSREENSSTWNEKVAQSGTKKDDEAPPSSEPASPSQMILGKHGSVYQSSDQPHLVRIKHSYRMAQIR